MSNLILSQAKTWCQVLQDDCSRTVATKSLKEFLPDDLFDQLQSQITLRRRKKIALKNQIVALTSDAQAYWSKACALIDAGSRMGSAKQRQPGSKSSCKTATKVQKLQDQALEVIEHFDTLHASDRHLFHVHSEEEFDETKAADFFEVKIPRPKQELNSGQHPDLQNIENFAQHDVLWSYVERLERQQLSGNPCHVTNSHVNAVKMRIVARQ